MSTPKINVIGVIYQNNFGERYFSRYFTKHCPHIREEPFNLKTFNGQRKFEKALLEKVSRMNVITKLTPEQSKPFL